MRQTIRHDFVRVSVGRGHIVSVSGKPSVEDQFTELAEDYRKDARKAKFSYHFFRHIFTASYVGSVKMRCWLAREVLDEMRLYYGAEIMARNSNTGSKDNTEVRDWGFVNVQLSDEERTAALLDYAESDTLWDTLVVALKDGYKVTLSYDGETDSYCAALSGTNCGKPNEKLTLTAWGENETDALRYVFYKHVTKLEFVWSKPGVKQRRIG